MKNNFEQYETLLANASEAAEVCLDMEDSGFLLARVGKLIQDLMAVGCFRGAFLTIQKMCETVGVDEAWAAHDELVPEKKSAWLNLFAGALMDHVMTAAE